MGHVFTCLMGVGNFACAFGGLDCVRYFMLSPLIPNKGDTLEPRFQPLTAVSNYAYRVSNFLRSWILSSLMRDPLPHVHDHTHLSWHIKRINKLYIYILFIVISSHNLIFCPWARPLSSVYIPQVHPVIEEVTLSWSPRKEKRGGFSIQVLHVNRGLYQEGRGRVWLDGGQTHWGLALLVAHSCGQAILSCYTAHSTHTHTIYMYVCMCVFHVVENF